MKEFEYINATSLDDALLFIKKHENTAIIAGGTDLITRMRSKLSNPEYIINIKNVPKMNGIDYDADLGVRIGASTLLDTIANDDIIKCSFNILYQSSNQIATPQIRNAGTIGGNLCQKPRCLYYRNPNFQCLRKGGNICYVIKGENKYSAIIDGGPCFMVNPSDLAPALIALDAHVKICSYKNERTIPLDSFYLSPKNDIHKENILNYDEMIAEIQIPAISKKAYGVYIKAMERKAWDFALASVALQVYFNDGIVDYARLVLGGISPKPFRACNAELAMKGNYLNDDIYDLVSEIALSDSRPFKCNAYKVSLAKSLIKQAMSEIKSKVNNGEG